MTQDNEMPEIGEVVVCRVTKVMDYGAFVQLLEYENLTGFVHISQVASRWVKNIRNFVREGQVRAAKVQSMSPEKNQIDLSLTKVSTHAQRKRIEEWKQLKRTKKLIERLAELRKKTFDSAWNDVALPLIEEYDNLYEGFQAVALYGEKAAGNVKEEWVKPLVQLAKKSVETPKRTVKGVLSLSSEAADGVLIIKDAIKKGLSKQLDAQPEIYYSGSGRYMLKVTSFDFKVAERVMNSVANEIIECMHANQGNGKLERLN